MKNMQITIIGLGLIGGSLALAFREAGQGSIRVTGMDADALTREKAAELHLVDEVVADMCESVQGADVVFLCTPVLQIVPLAKQIIPHLKEGAILTDVGSTKQYIQEQLLPILPGHIHYIGGHPMAGKEKSGVMAADKDLFRDRWYILMTGTQASLSAVATLQELLQKTGAILTTMDTDTHDRCTAVISHVPHVAAAALVHLLETCPDEESQHLVGGGFRDTTRIASSNADMWADICMTNQQAIRESLKKMQCMLERLDENIQSGDRQAIHHFFHAAKLRRDGLLAAVVGND
ncbi:MAG: Prephenate dehydrogenase [Firmicutes bacterium]|nr:Prephenate dehydrogenase [Bacillota bacterium]